MRFKVNSFPTFQIEIIIFFFSNLDSDVKMKSLVNVTLGKISSHILDLSKGKPAPNIEAQLFKKHKNKDKWYFVGKDITNQDGRMDKFLNNTAFENGIYKMVFESGNYYKKQKLETFFPEITILFKISDSNQKYHIPLLLNQYGYSTYRGS
jgi:5-hydroxyisourate hydrolase